ncbi:ADP-ribosylglycohydrolase family protein [Sporocytophaga sp.]|uniref:ADP-ribosylglycohydrolase family protein n=1 Tax=Sporocytophaga sp. TaxID=2231183 RepID=UPI0025F2C72E|nr:ADP-ribosylglycohydrolase family protein [Sporocytophaga sp.]
MDIKFKDILLGIAIGDAYGAGLEFQDRDWIRKNIDFSCFLNKRTDLADVVDSFGNTVKNYNEWDYTDDTEMTIGCIKALLSNKEFSEDLLMEHWIKEYEEDKKQKGIGRHGHGSMRWVYNGEKTIEEVRDFQKNRPNPGNGPTMRAIPFAFVSEDHIDRFATINANATHPNPKAVASSICIARATEYLIIKKLESEKIIDYCLPFIQNIDTEFYEKLKTVNTFQNFSQLSESEYSNLCGAQPIIKPYYPEGITGLPSDAMYTALSTLYILKHSKSTFEGFKQAIYLGGDVDSVASIITGILAGRYGLDSMPHYMKENVEGKAKLLKLADLWQNYYYSSEL